MEVTFIDHVIASKAAATVAVVVVMVLLRYGLSRMIVAGAGSGVLSERQRRRLDRVQLVTFIGLVLGPLLIWATELQNFALSLTAIAVAVVLATKELLLCLSGTLLRVGTRAFSIGDWIEIGAIKGEVVRHGPMATTLQEIDVDHNIYEYTGRTLVVPNSILLTTHVRNENFMKRYVFHQFSIFIEPRFDPFALEPLILDCIGRESADFVDLARRYNHSIRRRTGVDVPGPEPRVLISTTDLATMRITVSLFCPTQAAAGIQQAVTRDVMRAVYSRRPTSGEVVPQGNGVVRASEPE